MLHKNHQKFAELPAQCRMLSEPSNDTKEGVDVCSSIFVVVVVVVASQHVIDSIRPLFYFFIIFYLQHTARSCIQTGPNNVRAVVGKTERAEGQAPQGPFRAFERCQERKGQ